jgi:hypothetical protein
VAKRCAWFLYLFILLTIPAISGAQNECSVKNTAFKPGEQVTYKIYYHFHFVWLESGEVTFSVALKNYYNIPCYYLSGHGSTYAKYDWFYKVRDTFQTYLDTAKFWSMRFVRITNEGNTHVSNDNVFDNVDHKVYCLSLDKNNKFRQDSVHIPLNTFDVLTGVYYTRCLDFSKWKYNDTIPIKLYLDNHVYNVHIRYLGKENITSSLGKFRCIKFSVSLISGTIFKEGEEMTVWVTDDKNRLPVYIEAPIIIGSVRAELLSFSGLRNPMDAKVK